MLEDAASTHLTYCERGRHGLNVILDKIFKKREIIDLMKFEYRLEDILGDFYDKTAIDALFHA